jgi:signal transduction histidine kinase
MAVPLLADWCAVNLYDDDWTVHHVAVTHVDPAKVELARQVQQRYPTPREELLAHSQPWQQGQAQLIPEINEAMLKAGARNEDHFQILRDLRLCSAMVVPLLVRERVLGLITFFWAESNRRYDEQDLALAEELARRIAIALDNAWLYQAEQQARQAAEQTAERIVALQSITAAFAKTTTLAEVAKVVVERCVDILGAQGGVIALLDESGNNLETLDYVGYPPAMAESWRRYPISSEAPLPDAVRSGEPVFVESEEMFATRYPNLMATQRPVTYPALIGLPLALEGRMLGGVGLSFDQPQSFSPEEQAFILALVQQCAQAVERARLFEAEQQSRQAAEITAERLAMLQAVTARLAQAMTPAEVVQTVFMYGLSAMDASGITFASLNRTRDEFEIIKSVGYPAEVMASWQRFPVKPGTPMADAVQLGEPLYLESRAEAAALYPGLVAADSKNNHEAWAVLPLIGEHEAIGAVSISFTRTRVFDREDRAFLLTLARQSAQALERARLYEVEQHARREAEANQHRLALLAEMRERNRLAQELHDTVAQALGYLNLKISLTHILLESDQFEQAQANFKELRQVITETYTDVREEIFYLRARTLSDLSFLELLERYVDKYRRFYNLEIQLLQEADPALFEFSAETTSQLVRTIQEALINVRKHAQVNTATIRLGQENGETRISIEDQGQGFDAEQAKTKTTSFGLHIMRERVESIGGSLEVNSTAGQGTQIILRYRPNPFNGAETL